MRYLIACGLALVLAGCAEGLGRVGARPAPAAVTGLPLGEAPALRLASGQCALALWTRAEPAMRVAIAVSAPAELHIRLHGREMTLARTASEGEPMYGHAPRQTWSSDGVTLAMTATLAARDGMIGGAVAQDAMLVLTDRDGQEISIPVAGLVACQS
jgi:hypothetical protein